MSTAAEATISKQDKAKRLVEEAAILTEAEQYSAGDSEDRKSLGKIVLWQVRQSIDHGTLLRLVISGQAKYQLKTDCEAAHKSKTWPVRFFGVTHSVPISVAVGVIGFAAIMYCRKNGWM